MQVINLKKRKPSFFRSFISLMPYKGNLMTGQTRKWIVSVGLLIAIIALTEAIIWGNIFSFYFNDSLSPLMLLIGSIACGMFFFIIIWVVDNSFVTLDLTNNPADEKRKWYELSMIKRGAGIVARVVFVALGLYVTAPAIARLSIAPDVEKAIDDANDQQRSSLIKVLEAKYNQQISEKDKILSGKQSELEKEVAGKGASKAYGDKVVAKVIREGMAAVKQEREDLIKEKASLIDSIKNASFEALSGKYGVKFNTKTVGEIEVVVKEFEKNGNYKIVDNIARTYVILAFLALLLLKLFSPHTVKIYYNENLQDLFNAFINDQINQDDLIPLKRIVKDVNKKDITPLAFENYWRQYTIQKYNEANIRGRDEKMKAHEAELTRLHMEKAEIETEIDVVKLQYTTLHEAMLALEKQENELDAQAEACMNEIKEFKKKIEDFEAAIPSNTSPGRMNRLRQYMAESSEYLKQIENDKKLLKERKEQIKNELKHFKEQLEQLYELISNINNEKNELRRRYTNSISGNRMRIA